MQRHQSGRTVEPDQFLWLQHPNFCSGCQLARQIPYNYEGSDFTKAFKYNLVFHAMHVCVCMLCVQKASDWPYLTSSHGMLTHTWYRCVNVIGAAQTLALHRCLLSSHCCQNGGGREQCLTYPWSHSHQPKQVHCVRPVSHGEDHCGEARCGASSSHSLNISTPLLPSVQVSLCWEVNTSFFLLMINAFMQKTFCTKLVK